MNDTTNITINVNVQEAPVRRGHREPVVKTPEQKTPEQVKAEQFLKDVMSLPTIELQDLVLKALDDQRARIVVARDKAIQDALVAKAAKLERRMKIAQRLGHIFGQDTANTIMSGAV